MPPPSSDFILTQEIPNAGRGVLARKHIPSGTLLLRSPSPAAHVIFRTYKKEVCAQCFLYDRGRTLATRDPSTGKVFCTSQCLDQWVKAEDELGVEAWQALETFVKSRSGKGIIDAALLEPEAARPGIEAIASTWEESEEMAALQRQARSPNRAATSGPGVKAEREYRKALHHVWTQTVDPDVLGYLLSGVLFHHFSSQQQEGQKEGETWEDIRALAMDGTPYKSNAELEAHCNAFLQLVAIVPRDLLGSCTIEICQTLVAAGSHNSFGIRSGSEDDMEEYMGYALYPVASYFNHSCAPSVSKKRVGRCWEFRTAREVRKGEELCISYLGGEERDLAVVERRKRLQEVWGFGCGCERCRRESGKGNEAMDMTTCPLP